VALSGAGDVVSVGLESVEQADNIIKTKNRFKAVANFRMENDITLINFKASDKGEKFASPL